MAILEDGAIVLDHENLIEAEYRPYLYSPSTVAVWWRKMTSYVGKTYRYSSRLDEANRNELLERLHFHADDLKFVGTARNSGSKILVAEESDYSPEVRAYLLEHKGIQVLGVGEMIQMLRRAAREA